MTSILFHLIKPSLKSLSIHVFKIEGFYSILLFSNTSHHTDKLTNINIIYSRNAAIFYLHVKTFPARHRLNRNNAQHPSRILPEWKLLRWTDWCQIGRYLSIARRNGMVYYYKLCSTSWVHNFESYYVKLIYFACGWNLSGSIWYEN